MNRGSGFGVAKTASACLNTTVGLTPLFAIYGDVLSRFTSSDDYYVSKHLGRLPVLLQLLDECRKVKQVENSAFE